jgi:RNA polymerase sigma-70 factor (ECF subfamily)
MTSSLSAGAMVIPGTAPMAPPEPDPHWLGEFHQGAPRVLGELYRRSFGGMLAALTPLLGRADSETVIHEVFFRLLTQASLRQAFRGGRIDPWLGTVARNHALDYLRRARREVPSGAELAALDTRVPASWEADTQARLLVEQFRREVLPAKWAGVFEARFIQQLSQHEAAAALGIGRTTLAYREARVRRLLRRALLRPRPAVLG